MIAKLGLLAALLCSPILMAQKNSVEMESAEAKVRVTAQMLAAQYDTETGLFRGTGWWNSANGMTALADASRALRTQEFDSLFANTLIKAQTRFPLFRNEFYDDEGWWALAWIDIFELRHDARYLQMAESIFADMTGGWSDTCGGGIWWKKDKHYKNAIANELFLSVAAHLARVTSGKDRVRYLEWAQKEWNWFRASGMINDDSLINDGLNASCQNNHGTTWTYNQGVVLDGLATLSRSRRDLSIVKEARALSEAAMTRMTDTEGILHDVCEPKCNEDGVQFKGILARDLAVLFEGERSPVISHFLERNAVSVWNKARTPEGHFSTVWSGPPTDDSTGALISALDVLTAALRAGPPQVAKMGGGYKESGSSR